MQTKRMESSDGARKRCDSAVTRFRPQNFMPESGARLLAHCVTYLLAAAAVLFGARAAAENAAIPDFSPPGAGWLEIGDDFLPPPSGAGPVTPDPAHPYDSNISGRQPTYRVANLNNPVLKPWVVERLRQANQRVLSGHVPFQAHERCWPTGVPGFEVFSLIRPIYFLQSPKEVLIINEGDFQVRHVYLNVPHSEHPKPGWYGESVGHYENGDTLVVDTIGMNDKSFVDNYLTPHTTQLHVIERFQLTDAGKTLRVLITVDDPGAFNMPWSAIQVYRLQHRGNGDWDEDICAENNATYFSYDMAPMPSVQHTGFLTPAPRDPRAPGGCSGFARAANRPGTPASVLCKASASAKLHLFPNVP